MVKISYCPNCEKAHRFHLKKKSICSNCRCVFEVIEVPRSKFFIIQLPLVIIGFIIICFSAFIIYLERERFAEPLGYFILGFALILFGLAFQIMDNKNMEQSGREMGLQMFSSNTEKNRISDDRLKIVGKKEEFIKSERISIKSLTKPSSNYLFSKPNKPETIIKKPKHLEKNEPIRIDNITSLIKSKSGKKRARKIRKAL
jgi:hypothetical protein